MAFHRRKAPKAFRRGQNRTSEAKKASSMKKAMRIGFIASVAQPSHCQRLPKMPLAREKKPPYNSKALRAMQV
jgi:uncharacterized protein involved in propanediol utilization